MTFFLPSIAQPALCYGGSYGQDIALGIAVDKEGNAYITGSFDSPATFGGRTVTGPGGTYDIYVSKWDKNGNEMWTVSAGGAGFDQGNKIAIDTANQVYITGYYNSAQAMFGGNPLNNTGGNDAFLAKLSTVPNGIGNGPQQFPVFIYPNPSSGLFTIKLNGNKCTGAAVMDQLGRVVYERAISLNEKSLQLNLSSQSNGVYYLQLSGNGVPVTQKIVLNR